MNKTYQEDIHECWICGGTVELHVASAQCGNYRECPTRDRNITTPPVVSEEAKEAGDLICEHIDKFVKKI